MRTTKFDEILLSSENYDAKLTFWNSGNYTYEVRSIDNGALVKKGRGKTDSISVTRRLIQQELDKIEKHGPKPRKLSPEKQEKLERSRRATEIINEQIRRREQERGAKYNALARLKVTATGITVTPEMLDTSRGFEHIGYVIMPCEAFLKLTTHKTNYPTYKDLTEGDAIQPMSKYGARNKNIPYLEISMKDGRVVGHEGRHRAASLLKDGIKTMPVAIALYTKVGGYKKYHWWEYKDGKKTSGYLGLENIPTKWKNQWMTGFAFDATNVLKTFKWHYEGWGNP